MTCCHPLTDGPPPGRNVAVCFPFILPLSEKPKGHLSDSVVVDGTRSSHRDLASLGADALTHSHGEITLSWQRGRVCSFDDAGEDEQV